MSPRRYSIPTPLGALVSEWSDGGLSALKWTKAARPQAERRLRTEEGRAGKELIKALGRYFSGRRVDFGRVDIALDLKAASEWGLLVWKELLRIPYGEVTTYGEVARRLGRPSSARAVGGACGRNPVVILVPCHRVVASNGLGGYGAGLFRKERLLELEAGGQARAEGVRLEA